MPELPEMENYKNNLNQLLLNKRITDCFINREKSINMDSASFIQQVKGLSIIKFERRAKHLIFHLSNQQKLLLHLMLGGWLYFGKEEEKPKRTIQVQISFGEVNLFFIGLRLGYLHLLSDHELQERLSKLGPEPLDNNLTLNDFLEHTKTKGGKLKLCLVDQHFLSGIGNCYSDEICYHAQLLPYRKMEDLQKVEATKLYHSIRHILTNATNIGGYMENPFYSNDCKTGSYNDKCQVYDNEGKVCLRCGQKIIRDEISSKKTFYCPGCQH